MKHGIQNYGLLFVYTLLFTALIFVGKEIFLPPVSLEEDFLEPVISTNSPTLEEGSEYYSFSGVTREDLDLKTRNIIYDTFVKKHELSEQSKLDFRYIPLAFEESIESSYTPIAQVFLYKRDILNHIRELGVFFYKNISDTRGRMKGENIHLFGVEHMSDEEFLGVLIHEFAHYFDIHSMPRNSFGDQSKNFYDISWQSVSIVRAGQLGEDFVSGYAMTNQYEDFAESYLYYVLHNKEFRLRAAKSDALAQKYNFFQKYVFKANQFYNEDFGTGEERPDYYWDITKIPIDVKNFLQYVRDDI